MSRRTRVSLPTVDSCDGCGACCMHMGYPSYQEGNDRQPPEEPWISLPDSLRHELLSFVATYQEPPEGQLDGPCIWFDIETRRCKHHEHRPNVCRDFKINSEDCLGWREHYKDIIG